MWQLWEKTDLLRQKPAAVPPCPPQIPYELDWDQNRSSAVCGQR